VANSTCAMSKDIDLALRKGVRRALKIVIFVIFMETIANLFRLWLPPRLHHIIADSLDVAAIIAVIIMYRQVVDYVRTISAAYRELRTSERMRRDMTSMLIHDLRTPLSSALAALQVVGHGLPDECLKPEQEQLLDLAVDAQKRLEAMLGNLLEIARAEEGKLVLERTETDLGSLAQGAIREFAPQASLRGVTVKAVVDPLSASVDGPKMRRVVENLISNALRLTPSGGKIEVGLKAAPKEQALLYVADTGPGVKLEDRERIFDRFAQAASPDTGSVAVGLGLTFCKYVVEAHGGRIWVEDAPDGGALFKITLPLGMDAESIAFAEAHQASVA